jgi:hypothetical protein
MASHHVEGPTDIASTCDRHLPNHGDSTTCFLEAPNTGAPAYPGRKMVEGQAGALHSITLGTPDLEQTLCLDRGSTRRDLDSDEALSGAVVPVPKADAAVTSYQADLSLDTEGAA